MAVYGYIRVSTDKQTVENQRFEIENYCNKEKLSINEWVEEVVSGTKSKDERLLGGLIERMEKGDTLIVSEWSRVGRNMLDIATIYEECKQRKISLHTVKERVNTAIDNPMTELMVGILSACASFERAMISARTKEGLAKRKADGVILGRPVGSQQKTPNKKYEAMRPQIEEFLKKGLSKATIFKIMGINRKTLDKIIEVYKIPYPKKENKKSKIFKKGA